MRWIHTWSSYIHAAYLSIILISLLASYSYIQACLVGDTELRKPLIALDEPLDGEVGGVLDEVEPRPVDAPLGACLGISGMKGNEGYWGGEISIISQNLYYTYTLSRCMVETENVIKRT
jgi:hypothetical protein